MSSEGLNDNDKRTIFITLLNSLEEIYQLIIQEKDNIYQKFSYDTFEIVICFFILELGMLRMAKSEFGIDYGLEAREAEYPQVIEKYLRLMSAQRHKMRHNFMMPIEKSSRDAWLYLKKQTRLIVVTVILYEYNTRLSIYSYKCISK